MDVFGATLNIILERKNDWIKTKNSRKIGLSLLFKR